MGRQRPPVAGVSINPQITHRANFSLALAQGESVKEYDADSGSAAEISRLWLAIERSVQAINGAGYKTAMHRFAA